MSESTDLQFALTTAARYLQENEPVEAMNLLLPLYEAHDDHPDLAINLGGAYILQRKWRQAVQVLEPASQKFPENVMVWTNLAASYLGSLELSGPQQQKRAIEAYEQALSLNPYAPNVHYDLGLIYKDQHDYAKAIEYFGKAIQVNPADRDARLWLNRMEGALAEKNASAASDDGDATPTDSGGHSTTAPADDSASNSDGLTPD